MSVFFLPAIVKNRTVNNPGTMIDALSRLKHDSIVNKPLWHGICLLVDTESHLAAATLTQTKEEET